MTRGNQRNSAPPRSHDAGSAPRPGAELIVRIDALDEGWGVGRWTGEHGEVEVRVPGLVPGDVACVRVDAVSRHRPELWATTVEVLERSAHHRAPPCPIAWPTAGRCGGCQWMHVDDAGQAAAKAERARAIGERLGCEVVWHAPGPRLEWRNRSNWVVGSGDEGRGGDGALLGSWAPGTHDLVDQPACLVLAPPLQRAATQLRVILERRRARGGRELIRYITARSNRRGEVLVELIHEGADTAALLEDFAPILGEPVVGLLESTNRTDGNRIRDARATPLAGRRELTEVLGGVSFEVDTSTFLQLNPLVAEQMYGLAAQWCGDARVVWDLYGGIGSFGAVVARATGAAVWHAESVPASVEAAGRAGVANGLTIHPHLVDLSSLAAESGPDDPLAAFPRPDVVLVNPPRRGLDAGLRARLPKLGGRIIYMSCNPATFERDALDLAAHGLRFSRLAAFDMMPQTSHFELLAVSC